MRAQYPSQRVIEHMRKSVIRDYETTTGVINMTCDAITYVKFALGHGPHVHHVSGCHAAVGDCQFSAGSCPYAAYVSNLAACFGIKTRAIQHQPNFCLASI